MHTESTDPYPYAHYLFFELTPEYYRQTGHGQEQVRRALGQVIGEAAEMVITPYTTLGYKAGTTFMLWCRAATPFRTQDFLRELLHSEAGPYLRHAYNFFGIVRNSQYSGRAGKGDQVMQNYTERLPYFVLYPFTKTPDWYLLDYENRRSMMGQHIKIGVGYPDIRQCLLYSYGLDDPEFVVSYEMNSPEEFQDLIMDLRQTLGRRYTASDTPIFTCLYKPLPKLLEWL